MDAESSPPPSGRDSYSEKKMSGRDSYSEKKGAGLPFEHIGIQVTEYICVGDEAIFDFHVFTVRVWNEREKLSYAIQRSYSAFCEFHAKLSKKYPRTSLPIPPLTEYNRFLKQLEKAKGDGKSTKLSASLSVPKGTENKMKRKDLSEVISQKKPLLAAYLEDLLRLPEVLMADEFLMFLDEESNDGLTLPQSQNSAVDICLLGVDPETKTVLRSHEITREAEQVSIFSHLF